ncbi:hypothetical protein B9Z19DRAFT_1164860 [Tuber borchii]|uniref:P-loop containing nucleoside triphosphate hydrolase protein n=1 Tax=Tuber borchii TaxID=42251 RepID=A0A2T6ZCB9_TUBBO|nr:hypothetical protein B9Z19DRAFT_1164860 [Tuber borchii]
MGEKLSGGNKLLLDEPSLGMDVASKRTMWKILTTVQKGRSLVLTTHSMEEADALASRTGILAKKMLAAGASDDLQKRWGDGYRTHLVLKSAPASTEVKMHKVKDWVQRRFRGAVVEQRSFHGQIRYSVPIWRGESEDENDITSTTASQPGGTSVNRIFKALEVAKDALGLEYYSVSQTTLAVIPPPLPFHAHTNCSIDQVFLTIAGSANVAEEGYEVKKKWFKFWK